MGSTQDPAATMPVERMRMRPWLEEQINSCQIPGLKWVNKERKTFQIPWMHAARHGWDLQKDAPLFMKWAIHTGKYDPGVDRPDPKTWKANFRCAVNSLPDMEEVKDKSIKKGTNAFRVYKMLSASERLYKKGKKKKDGRPKGGKEGDLKVEEVEGEATLPVIKREVYEEDGSELYSTLGNHNTIEDHVITSEQLPFVCQTIEVTTENEEQMVSSSHSYPLQISPVSSYCDSDTDSLNSETEDAGEGVSGPWRRNYSSSILRMPSCPLPSMASFMANKPNLRITTIQDPNPLISYHAEKWSTRYVKSKPGTTGHEVRASVIMKTSDVNSS
ncbi:Interferon regulatory factor 2 [Merluccius polli]|uniref:Interferon regulatory factor n=1 Tax=Merluccius polli TaxID=89951 RepID=A0AA47N5H1_MERPO|nr:Interferon regulatory factor 2 [Merluccius polli]